MNAHRVTSAAPPDSSNAAGAAETETRVSPEAEVKSREERIAVIAYHKAQQRGFEANRELDDWLEAEQELEAAEYAAAERLRREQP